jgi:ribonuclease P protein component
MGLKTERRFSFPVRYRLRRALDIARVRSHRCSASDNHLVAYAAPNGLAHSRMAISVRRKIGNAVVRNRIKRRVREAYRTTIKEIPAGRDYLFVARLGAPRTVERYHASMLELTADLERLLSERFGVGARNPESGHGADL